MFYKEIFRQLIISSYLSQKTLTKIIFSIMKILLLYLFQKCGTAFFLAQSGECLPCNCHGNSDECLDGSGFCVVGQEHLSLSTLFPWGLCILGGDKILLLDI